MYTDKEIQDLAASYAMGLLSDEEKAEFETMIKQSGTAAAHHEHFKAIVEYLSYCAEAMKEPESLHGRLFSLIDKSRAVHLNQP